MTEIAIQPEKPTLPTGERAVKVAKRVSGNSHNRLNALRRSIADGTKIKIANAAVVGTMLLHAGCAVDTPQNPSLNAPNKGGEIVQMIKDATPAVSSLKLKETRTPDGHIIVFDENLQIPTSVTMPDGKVISFDRNEMGALKDQAIASKEPVIATVLPSVSLEDIQIPSIDHPVLSEKPKDVLSEEELRQHGITVIQGENTQLSIRKNALLGDGPLARYAARDPKKNLTIALVDGPIVQGHFLQDPKYDSVRDLYPKPEDEVKQAQEFRQSAVSDHQTSIEKARQRLQQARVTGDKQGIVSAENNLLERKRDLFAFEKLTNDQLLTRFYEASREAGLYLPRGNITDFIRDEEGEIVDVVITERNVIFLAVGRRDNDQVSETVIAFTSEGKPVIENSSHSFARTMEPRSSQSHPNPASYGRDSSASEDNPMSYPYAAQSTGFALRHEISHDELIRGNIDKGLERTFNEYTTDTRAFAGVKNAWDRWERSGYTDNGGYHFVFSLPGGKGYILTEKPDINKPSKAHV